MRTILSDTPTTDHAPVAAQRISAALLLALVLMILVAEWMHYGVIFYSKVLPFYDSQSYQLQYGNILQSVSTKGVLATAVETYSQPSNTALFRFFAAFTGGLLTDPVRGLYVYLFLVVSAATAVLFAAVSKLSRSPGLGLLAAAAWLSAVPFSQTVYGVIDQRLDLTAASFYMMVCGLGLLAIQRLAVRNTLALGIAASLAVLHRPVMGVTIFGAIGLLCIAAYFLHRRETPRWLPHLGLLIAVPLVLAIPWLLTNAKYLYFYYFIWNVDVGNGHSWMKAARFHLQSYGAAVGWYYGLLIAAGLIFSALRKNIRLIYLLAALAIGVLPLLILIASRSVGNGVVSQAALGAPALLLCGVYFGRASRRTQWILIGIGSLALGLATVQSVYCIKKEVSKVSAKRRMELNHAIAQIASVASGQHVQIASFNANVPDANAIATVARALHYNFEYGSTFCHPTEFGVENRDKDRLSAEQTVAVIKAALQKIKQSSDTHLVLPSQESQHALNSAYPWSHHLIPEIRKCVEEDAAFKHLLLLDSVNKCRLDLYQIDRR